MIDPNPLVSGRGKSELESEGVKVYVGEHEDEAEQINEAYAKFITTGMPFVTAKFAISLDGKIATKSGDSKWISGEESRKYVHTLRYTSDAIMAGVNTVLADDPQLTARDESGKPLDSQPLRVIVDSKGRLPLEARLLSEPGQTLVAVANADETACHNLKQAGVKVERVPAEDGSVDLPALMKVLGQREITSVLVEGGGILLGALFAVSLDLLV